MRQPKVLHPELTSEERRRLLVQGVELFNAGEAYAAHEAWEEVWRSTNPEPKQLLQGLIQAAAVIHQIRDLGRRSGPRGTLGKALANLAPYGDPALPASKRLGLEITKLLADLERVRTWLESEDGDLPNPELRVADSTALS